MMTDSIIQGDYDRRWAVACYVPIFNVVSCAVTAVRKIESKFCLYHARMGLVLFSFWFLSILVAILSPTIALMMWGALILLHIAGVVMASGGKMSSVPLLTFMAMKIPEDYIYKLLTKKLSVTTGDDKGDDITSDDSKNV